MSQVKKIFFGLLILSTVVSCGRKTSDGPDVNGEPEIILSEATDTTSITAEDPFRNQPNELCTIIRKLDVSYYSPKTVVEDISQYPKKYCLLDICLDKVDNADMTISLGEEGETVTTTFELIRIFEDEASAKIYAEKYKISDVKWE